MGDSSSSDDDAPLIAKRQTRQSMSLSTSPSSTSSSPRSSKKRKRSNRFRDSDSDGSDDDDDKAQSLRMKTTMNPLCAQRKSSNDHRKKNNVYRRHNRATIPIIPHRANAIVSAQMHRDILVGRQCILPPIMRSKKALRH